ncbi:MAG: aspartate aminotransferase family protein [Bacteroidetes bacterium]|nr:aspartate aminotransferase family protein [Bacteroidota bacterium]
MQLTNRQIFQQHLATPAKLLNPLEIVKAEGIYIFDDTGKKYIDLVSGVSVSNVGHVHPKVVKAVKDQLDKYMHLMVYGKYIQSPQVLLTQKLVDKLPDSLNSVYFVNSGSEAIEGALKLAKRITGRTQIIAFNNAYHGSTHGALSVLGNEEMKNAFRPLLPGVDFYKFSNNEVIEGITSRTACIIMEPIQTEAGIIIPDIEWLIAIRQKCDETGTMLIFDEVQLGFGRSGKLFAFENFNIIPDILCLAKAMGAGMPIGAFISSSANMNLLTHNPALGHITTFGGHPVSCAAALAGFAVITDEELHLKANQKGKLFVDLLTDQPSIKEIRQMGLMLGVEIVSPYTVSDLISIFLKNGLIVDQFLFNETSFRIAPPLTITEDEIKLIASKIIISLQEMCDN